MRARVSLTTLRRLDRVEQTRSVNRPRGEWPPMMGADEWEAKATEYLARLCGQESLPEPPAIANHYDVTHCYKRLNGEVRRGQTEVERAAWDAVR